MRGTPAIARSVLSTPGDMLEGVPLGAPAPGSSVTPTPSVFELASGTGGARPKEVAATSYQPPLVTSFGCVGATEVGLSPNRTAVVTPGPRTPVRAAAFGDDPCAPIPKQQVQTPPARQRRSRRAGASVAVPAGYGSRVTW